MLRRWLYSESSKLALSKASMALAAVVVLTAGWFLLSLQQASSSRSEAETMMVGQKRRIADLKDILDKGKGIKVSSAPTGMDSVAAFQSYVEQTAAKYECDIDEFVASRDVGTYLSRFEKDTTETSWAQVQVKTRVQGRAADVMAVLQSLKDSGITFEFCTLEIVRQAVINAKESRIAALVELNVLIQPEGGTS
jgi:hypothetical protein